MKIILDDGAIMPIRAHENDAGLDLFSPNEYIVPANGAISIETGVHVELPRGTAGFLKSKSGLNVKYDITSEGVIDCGYTGGIVVRLRNHGTTPYQVYKGDKISQLVVIPILTPKPEIVDSFKKTERGNNGFGSTGR